MAKRIELLFIFLLNFFVYSFETCLTIVKLRSGLGGGEGGIATGAHTGGEKITFPKFFCPYNENPTQKRNKIMLNDHRVTIFPSKPQKCKT